MEETQESSIAGKKTEVASPIAIEPSKEVYIPSSTERKRAVMMYILIGIIASSFNENEQKSGYELFHLKQALWWWAVFFLLIVTTSVFMFIPMIKYIPLFAVLIMVIFLAIFIKRARDGKYSILQENKLSIFAGLGEWISALFEVTKEESSKPQEQKPLDQKVPEVK